MTIWPRKCFCKYGFVLQTVCLKLHPKTQVHMHVPDVGVRLMCSSISTTFHARPIPASKTAPSLESGAAQLHFTGAQVRDQRQTRQLQWHPQDLLQHRGYNVMLPPQAHAGPRYRPGTAAQSCKLPLRFQQAEPKCNSRRKNGSLYSSGSPSLLYTQVCYTALAE